MGMKREVVVVPDSEVCRSLSTHTPGKSEGWMSHSIPGVIQHRCRMTTQCWLVSFCGDVHPDT